MKQSRPLFFILLIFVSLFLDIAPGFAQDGNPPLVDPNGAWGEVMNPDGSINYANLTDGGVVTQPADWMPSIPGVGPVDPEYHVYTTPSGNTILMPTASTLFFMSANPSDSGFDAAASAIETPLADSFVQHFRALVRSRARALFIYGEADVELISFRVALDTVFARLSPEDRARLEVELWPGDVHGFLNLAMQRRSLERALDWFAQFHPAAADANSVATAPRH